MEFLLILSFAAVRSIGSSFGAKQNYTASGTSIEKTHAVVVMANRKKGEKRVRPAHPHALAYSINEAASVLGVSRSLIYDLLAEGELESFKIRSKHLIARSALEKLIPEAAEDT